MPLSTRSFAGLAALRLLFLASSALAQPESPDALEQPYDGSEPSVRPTPPPAKTPAPAPSSAPAAPRPAPPAVSRVVDEAPPVDTRPQGPIRARRRLALTGEVGWNGLAGFGPVLGYHVDPHFTLEGGVGISLTGFKGGLRARYNLLTSTVTPFVGAGFLATGGLGVVQGPTQDDNGTQTKEDVTIRVRPSQFIQAVGGVDWTSPGGFTLVGTFGWAALLNHNLDIVAGNPTADDREGFDIIFKSGPVIAVATGYTFQ